MIFPQLSWAYADEETWSLSLTHYVSVFVPETKREGGRNSLFLREWITETIDVLIPAVCLGTSCYTLTYIMDMCYTVIHSYINKETFLWKVNQIIRGIHSITMSDL